MIPTDLAARLRQLSESIVQPVGAVRGIPAELPEFPVGRRFTARIEAALPDGSFRAVVANRNLTLSLPEAAQAGDTLDLVVTGRTARLVAAQRADAPPATPPVLTVGQRFLAHIESALPDGTYRARVAGSPLTLALPETVQPGRTYELLVAAVSPRLIGARHAEAAAGGRTQISPTGQMLGALLAENGQPPQAPVLARAEPLLSRPPEQAVLLAPAMKQAIVESGLFYEAHQAQWIAGRYPAEALRREPQARLPRPGLRNESPVRAEGVDPAAAQNAVAGDAAQARAGMASGGLAAELQLLVQQQLDAADTQHIVWRGELWPGQDVHWEIEAEERQGGETAEESASPWTTSLKLTLPRLGEINAVLRLDAGKVSLAMTAVPAHAATLRGEIGELASAFAAAGLPPLSAHLEAHG